MSLKDRLSPIASVVVAIGLIYFGLDMLNLSQTGKVESIAQTREMVQELGRHRSFAANNFISHHMVSGVPCGREFFKSEGISFISADIEHDATAARLFRKVTGGRNLGIPQIVIGDEVIGGYGPWQIRKALKNLTPEKSPQ